MSESKKAQPGDGTHLFDYVRILLKRLWLIVGVFVLIVGVVGVATCKAVPQYRATATIEIRQPSTILGRLDPSELIQSVSNSQIYMNTRYELIRSRATVEAMVTDAGLESWDEFKLMGSRQIANAIMGNIEVEPQRNTTLVRVSVVDSRKAIVHRITNALVTTFAKLQGEAADSSVSEVVDRLEKKWIDYVRKKELVDNKIARLLQVKDTDRETFLEKYEFVRTRLRSKQGLIDSIDVELARNRSFYQLILKAMGPRNGNGDEGEVGLAALLGHAILRKDPHIAQEREELLTLKGDLQWQIRMGKAESNANVVVLKREILDQQALIEQASRDFLLGYLHEYEALAEQKTALGEQLKAVEDEFRSFSTVKREYDEQISLSERYEMEGSRYFALYEKLQGDRKSKFKPIGIVDLAQQPHSSFKPNPQMNMILAVIFGLFAGVAVAFFLEYLDDTIKTKEELQRITDVPLFGVIPNITARRSEVAKKDLFAYNQPKSTISEAFRGIRTALSYSSQKGENRVYLITSSGPKEGKSTIVINVATVMAYSGTRTLLVDADLRRPRIHKSFELPNTRGLSNLIIGDATAEDVVQSTEVENLFVLPSGPIPPNPSELLGRERMREILEQLRGKYDRILIDTPPIGAVTDAVVLARIVDSVILVVHAGKTRKKLIERGLEQLSQIDVDVSGVVLNNLKIGRKRYYPGYYHYYYYYSTYYGADDQPRPREKDEARGQG